MLLAEALGRYAQAGAGAWAGRVLGAVAGAGRPSWPARVRAPAGGRLAEPDRDRRAVSLLVAEGLTTGAVARRLYIWPHTVNTDLRHVFARLGGPDRGWARRRGTSLDQVMSWPPPAGTIDR